MTKKLSISLAANLGYIASHLILVIKRDFNFPVFLVRKIPEIINTSPSLILSATQDVITNPKTIEYEYKRILKHGKSDCEMHILNGQHCTMLKDDGQQYDKHISAFLRNLNSE